MYKISKQFSFSASHVLDGLPTEHPCSRLHGHNYVLTVFLKSETLDEKGFVKDYRELSVIKDYIDNKLDHRHLNDVFDINPTAENIAKELFTAFEKIIPQLYAVEVSETPKTSARYEVER
ncbi:MAG: 6-carboxytetrahydropterin synthase QueD [Bacteroidota bacterium]|jgi:6-pyruvoyltetrahydropterin/6-carboxytetrahydropterin synthase